MGGFFYVTRHSDAGNKSDIMEIWWGTDETSLVITMWDAGYFHRIGVMMTVLSYRELRNR